MKLTLIGLAMPATIHAKDMEDGDFAVIVSVPAESFHNAFDAIHGVQLGEILYRNVAGWHSLTANRYWPDDYKDKNRSSYIPDFRVRVLEAGDVLTVAQ